MVVGGFVKKEILKLFRRDIGLARRAIFPQATELIHLYRNIVQQWEFEGNLWAESDRCNMILNAIVSKFNEVTTNNTSIVEDNCFDSWLDKLPVEVGEMIRKFQVKIQESKKVEAKKNKMYNKALERKRKEERSTSKSKFIPVEVRHLLPRLDTQNIRPVQGCTTQDTFDIVLLQWMIADKTISLRHNPHFYDNLEGLMSRAPETLGEWVTRDALKFSAILSPRLSGKAGIIIHCVTDNHEYPLILFKQIPGWTFAQLCWVNGDILLKGTSGQLMKASWYQKQLSREHASIHIKKRESLPMRNGGSPYVKTTQYSLAWKTLLDEVGNAMRANEKCTWIVEDDCNALLNEYGLANLPFSASDSTSSHIPSISSNAPSMTSLLSGKTVVALSNESGTFDHRPAIDTSTSLSVQDRPGNNVLSMPRPHITNALPTTPGPVDIGAPHPGGFVIPTRPAAHVRSRQTLVQPPFSTGDAVGPSMPLPNVPKSSEPAQNQIRSPPVPISNAPAKKTRKSWFTRAKEFVGFA